MAKHEPQIILKTDERKLVLELGLGGKFTARSTAWDENRVFLEGDKLEVAVNNGRWVLTHLPAAASGRGAGAAPLPGRRVTALLQRCCNGVTPFHLSRSRQATVSAMKRTEATVDVRAALANNLRDRAPDPRAYAQSSRRRGDIHSL